MENVISTKALLKASLAAIVFAALALVCFILPAEYNVDPTGIGAKLGLTVLAQTAAVEVAATSEAASEQQEELVEVIVPAGKGIEYKFAMKQYDKLSYEWLTDGEPLYFDLHGEPEGDTTGYFESYAIATLSEMKGSFTAPFTGSHGWYWKNTSGQSVLVTLTVNGQFELIGLK